MRGVNMWEIENSFFSEETRVICGVDEAGRGPLAGPVVAGAVILMWRTIVKIARFFSRGIKVDERFLKVVNGGFKKAIGRIFSGESIFLNEFTPIGASGMIAFASSFPGSIIPFNITEGNGIIVQKTHFL